MTVSKLRTDLKEALKKKESLKVDTLRLLLAEIHNKEMEKQADLNDEEETGVIRKEVKKREEAIDLYRQGKRDDLVRKEHAELEVLRKYLPREMASSELEENVREVIEEMGEVGKKDFGKVMGVVMGRLKGRAEGGRVAEVVKKMLI